MPNDELVTPGLDFVFEARVAVGPPQDLGDVGKGGRRIVPITGGEFSGPQMRGEVLPGGADWQVLRSDGPTAWPAAGSSPYAWITRHIIVCTGAREQARVLVRFYKLT